MASSSSQPPMTMDIDTSTIKRWAAEMDASAATIIQQYMNLALKTSSTTVMQREMQEAPRGVTQQLAKGIKVLITVTIATIRPTAPHSIYIEKGTAPHMPPIDAITPWAESKGLNPWAVALSIKKKGTVANPFVDRTFKATKPLVITEFDTATKLIAQALAKEGATL